MGFVVGAKYTMTMKQRDQGQEERQKVRRSFPSDNDVRRPDRRAAQCDGRTEGDTPPGLFRNGRGSGGPDGSRYRGQREGAGLSREACVLCAPPSPPTPPPRAPPIQPHVLSCRISKWSPLAAGVWHRQLRRIPKMLS